MRVVCKYVCKIKLGLFYAVDMREKKFYSMF